MDTNLKNLFAAVSHRHLLCAAITLALAACGGGDGGDGDGSTYFAVVGTRTAGGVPMTICVNDATYADPASPAGQAMAANLARYAGLQGGYQILAGTQRDCRAAFPAVDQVLSVSDYNTLVLPAAVPAPSPAPAPTPTPAPAPTPTPAPAPTAVAAPDCVATHGGGTNGLSLTGQSQFSGLSLAANNVSRSIASWICSTSNQAAPLPISAPAVAGLASVPRAASPPMDA